MQKKPTLRDVAQVAGVSVTTVSAVINKRTDGNIRVSDETRERVWLAVEALGYRPNLSARQMRTQKSNIIGFITDEITTTPYAVGIIRGAQDEAWHDDYMLLIANTGGDSSREEQLLQMMISRGVDGIIYATWIHRQIATVSPILYEAPSVLVHCFDAEETLPSITPDEQQSAYNAVAEFIKQGHQRIGLINLWSDLPPTHGRYAGYVNAHHDHNIPIDEELVGPGHVENSTLFEVGYHEAKRLMTISTPPTAVFCANDRIAMGLYEALKENHIAIPEQIAVIGFDNQVDIAQNLRPALSTMALPFVEMGKQAVHFLINHDTNDLTKSLPQIKITCEFIARDSH